MQRFEPLPRDTGIEEGLAARIHDPLWLLARQWQFGEFRSENAASPAWVDAEAEIHVLDGWRPAAATTDRPFAVAGEPLEKLVEEEPARGPDPWLRLDGGARLARLPDGSALADPLGRLAAPGTRAAAATALGLPASSLDAVVAVAADWLAWWRARAPAPPAEPGSDHPPAWDGNRMEYRFEVAASTLPGVRLTAAGYTGGRLDWWGLDAASEDAPAPAGETLEVRGVPAPAAFGGMPAPRFWEMEDARFDPGRIDAAPNDLGRMLLTTFATVYGNDWFVLPLRLPAGSLSRMTRFMVTDVFGSQRLLTAAGADDDGWSLFALTDASTPPDPEHERPTSPWFLLAPALPDALDGPALERVMLLRDEMANLAWAVETHVTDDAGAIVERFAERDASALDEPELASGDAPRYRVETSVPRNWYPLAPEQLSDGESVRLRLVPVLRGGEPGRLPELPRGRLLADAAAEGAPVWLHEEEVPRAGAALTRAFQRARSQDGSTHTWVSRTKRTGGGEGSSGLRFDTVEP